MDGTIVHEYSMLTKLEIIAVVLIGGLIVLLCVG